MKTTATLAMIALASIMTACGKASNDNAVSATTGPGTTGYLAKIAALPPGQVRGVVFRAIADANGDCQAISDLKRAPDKDGHARWGARCTNGKEWNVSIGDDGVAQVGSQN